MSTFKRIASIEDVRPFVADTTEIRFVEHPNGVTIGCYTFTDRETFAAPEAIECRGIAFDRSGAICSRPLHKFFNLGERDNRGRLEDVAAVYEKLDGSMIATAWVDGALAWRSKVSFGAPVVRLAEEISAETPALRAFAADVAAAGMTAIFELVHPDARIVVRPDRQAMTLLHVRENVSGDYVTADPTHPIHGLIKACEIPVVERHDVAAADALAALESMEGREGFVFHLADGDMIKAKCLWYLRIHRGLSLRERDVAKLAISGSLDDLRGIIEEGGGDAARIDEIEARIKAALLSMREEVATICAGADRSDRKAFAIAHKDHPLFGLAMRQFCGQEPDFAGWYARNRLDAEFGLDPL